MKRQRGVALLIAILAVALAALLVAALLETGEDARARTRNTLRAEQAHAYALGLEAWAIELLRRDAAEGPGFDSHASAWAQDLPPLPVPGGRVTGALRDRNGCLNLNDLVVDGQPQPVPRQRLERLLEVLGLDLAIAAQVVDWIDIDSTPESGGAEDLQYLLERPPYRAANRPFVHVSELRLLRAVNGEVYQRLRPHVCALPAPGPEINVNTASVPVLMALDPAITEPVARRLHQDGRARFSSVEDFKQALARAGVELPQMPIGIGVRSTHFVARADILIDDLPIVWYSLVQRDGQQVAVHWRTQSDD
ncbi:MAG TPA: type II secretion system minor pseudopilin GspK [Xanthomonadaceae bacterium]|nr:type II secretion system minor pseudopilin GspK [Xanthomonadaceae bacterium]